MDPLKPATNLTKKVSSAMPEPPQPEPLQNATYQAPWEKAAQQARLAKEIALKRAEKRTKKERQRRWQQARRWALWIGFFAFWHWLYTPHGIFVLADPLSVTRYRGVLSDLKREMPAEYELVRDHIDQIKIAYIITGGNYAGYAQEGVRGDKKITLLENTFIQGPGYAHSVLVHEACHGLQFEKNLPFSPFCENQSREHACNQWGIKVLKHFNANTEMIEHYQRLAEGDTVYGNSCLRRGQLEVMPEL